MVEKRKYNLGGWSKGKCVDHSGLLAGLGVRATKVDV
jgi:hypothetical protein